MAVTNFPADPWILRRLSLQRDRADLIEKRDRLNRRIADMSDYLDRYMTDEARQRQARAWQELNQQLTELADVE